MYSNTPSEAAAQGEREDVLAARDVVLPLHMFWVKKIEKVPKVTLYAYLFKPNPPNSAK